jgi:hypothetical protein
MRKQLLSLLSCVLAFSGCVADVEPTGAANGTISAEALGDGGAGAAQPPRIGFADVARPDGTEPLQLPFALPDPRELGAPPTTTAKGETRALTCRTLPTDGPPSPPPRSDEADAPSAAEPPPPPPFEEGGTNGSNPGDDADGRPPGLLLVQIAVFDHGFDAKAEPKPRPDFVVECLAPPGEGPLSLPQATIDEIVAAHGGREAIALIAVARFAPPPPPPGAEAGDAAGPPPGDRPPPPPSGDLGDADSGARPPPPRGRGLYTLIATTALPDGLAALVPPAPPK